MLSLQGHRSDVRSVAFAAQARRLASAADDEAIRIWSLPGGRCQRVIKLAGSPEVIAFSPDGSMLAVGVNTVGLIVFNTSTGKELSRVDMPRHGVRCLAFTSDSEIVYTGGWDGRVRSVNVNYSDQATLMKLPVGGAIMGLAVRSDGAMLAVGDSLGNLNLRRLNTRGKHITSKAQGGITSLAFAPNGPMLAVGLSTGAITLWDSESGELRSTLTGHTWTVNSVDFTPTGDRLVSGSADGTIRVWDIATGTAQHIFAFHEGVVRCAVISPDGMTVASAGSHPDVLVWDTPD